MGAAAVPGKNPRVFTASGQTLTGGTKVSRISWAWPNTIVAGTLILREGASASPDYIITLRGRASTPDTIQATIGSWHRNLNVLTMTAGTLYVHIDPPS